MCSVRTGLLTFMEQVSMMASLHQSNVATEANCLLHYVLFVSVAKYIKT